MYMILLISSMIALILLIWFRTDAWLEYCKLFGLDFVSFYPDYNTKKTEDATLKYLLYLRRYHNCFFVRLITCPICLAVWLGIFCGILTAWASIPIYIIGGLLLFAVIDHSLN